MQQTNKPAAQRDPMPAFSRNDVTWRVDGVINSVGTAAGGHISTGLDRDVENLTVAQLVNNSPSFMGPMDSYRALRASCLTQPT
jgi:hypothetical protein